MKKFLTATALAVALMFAFTLPANASGPCSNPYACTAVGEYSTGNVGNVGIGLTLDGYPSGTYQMILNPGLYYAGKPFASGSVASFVTGPGYCTRWTEYKRGPQGQLFGTFVASGVVRGKPGFAVKYLYQYRDYKINAYPC